jgi:hypothetical protein
MVSLKVLDWLEMCGDELLVKYDSALAFGELLERTIHPARAI